MAWVPLLSLVYIAAALHWARVAAIANGSDGTWFSAGHDLSPWVSALMLAGASISAWAVLGVSAEIGTAGFALPTLVQAGVLIALPGVFFFKRLWLVGRHLRLSSQGELFRALYSSEFLVAVSAVVAVLFAVCFAGLQLLALSNLSGALSGGAWTADMVSFVLGAVLVGSVAIGGMRAVAWFGAIQAVLAVAALAGLATFALIGSDGFGSLNDGLAALAADPARAGSFIVAGVIQFTGGIGREAAAGHEGTALANLSLAFALMGFQASPLALKVVLSTRSLRGLAAGQTWIMAGAFGALIALGATTIGAATLLDARLSVAGLLAAMSPWFAGWLFLGLVAGAQLLAGLGLLTAAEALVRSLVKPWYFSSMSGAASVALARIAVALLALASVLMQTLAPVTLSALGALALPLAFQLWTPLLGLTMVRWFTAPAVSTGVGFGIAGVLLTEPAGNAFLSFVGLDLPWGRWPWTINSALWGMAPNLAVTLLISAFTQRHALGNAAADPRQLLSEIAVQSAGARALRPTAWAVAFAWLFLAVGPGLILGNSAFGGPSGPWALGMPSLWAWGLLFWALGLGLVWFLSYKMELASPFAGPIPPLAPPLQLPRDMRAAERRRLRALTLGAAATFALVALTALSFG